MVDMNPLTIQPIRSRQQDTASTSNSVRQLPAVCQPVAKTATGCPSTAITDVSAVLSGDRLVVSVAEAGRLLGVSGLLPMSWPLVVSCRPSASADGYWSPRWHCSPWSVFPTCSPELQE